MADIIKPKRTTYSVAINSTKILEKDEMLVITPDTGSGTGKYMVVFGDGVTQVKNLPMSVDGKYADELIINSLETLSESNPTLSAGDSIKRLLSKIKKNIETLIANKISTTSIYSGLDSSNGGQVLAAPAGKQLKQLCDNNASAISTLNSDFANRLAAQLITGQRIIDKNYQTGIYLMLNPIDAWRDGYFAVIVAADANIALCLNDGALRYRSAGGVWSPVS